MNKKEQPSNKISRRDFLRLATIGGVGLAASACAPQVIKETVEVEVEKVVTATPKPSGEVAHIKWLTQEQDPGQVDSFRKAISDFEAENPDIRIELQFGSPEQNVQKMVTVFTSGAASLDMLQITTPVGYLMATQGYILPIDELVQEMGGEDFWTRGTLLKHDDHVYAVPHATERSQIWYRKDYFEADGIEIPTSWEEFEEVCRHFTKKFNPNSPTEYGLTAAYGQNYTTTWLADPFMWSNGAEFFDKDLNLVIQSDEMAEFLAWYAGINQYVSEAATGFSWGDMITNFLAEQSAMTLYTGRVLSRAYDEAPHLVGNIDVFNYPKRKLEITLDDPNYYMINANTEYPEQCMRWLKYLTTTQVSFDYICSVPTHLLPANQDQAKWFKQDVTGCEKLDENVEIKEHFEGLSDIAYYCLTNSGGVHEAKLQGKDKFVATGVANPIMDSVRGSNQFMAQMLGLVTFDGVDPHDAIDQVMPDMEAAVKAMKEEVGI